MSRTDTQLELLPSARFPRQLNISWRPGRVVVTMHAKDSTQMLAFGSVELGIGERLYLERTVAGIALWVGSAAFDVSDAEFERIRECFEPLGLPVKFDSPPAVVPASAMAHEAAASTPLGDRGMQPATPCEGAGRVGDAT